MHVERNPFTQEDSHYVIVTFINNRVPTAQGKWPKKFPVREDAGYLKILQKHSEFGLLKL